MDATVAAVVATLVAAPLAMAPPAAAPQPATLSPTPAAVLEPVPDPLAGGGVQPAVPLSQRNDRSAVVPAAAQGPAGRSAPAAATATAGALVPIGARSDGDPLHDWRAMLDAAAEESDARWPVGLADVLPGSSGHEACQRVAGYWRFAAACARHGAYAAEHALLRELLQRDAATADPLLRSAVQLADAARRVAEAEYRAAQQPLRHWLAGRASGSGDTPPLWPADVPHASGYQTHLAELFAGRTPPPRVAFLDRTLPLQQQLAAARAEAVAAASDALDAALRAWEQGALPTEGLLRRVSALRQERLAAIDALLDYNLHIAEYATAVAGHVAVDTLPRLLLKDPAPRHTLAPALPRTQPASSPETAVPRSAQGAATLRRAFKPLASDAPGHAEPDPPQARSPEPPERGDLQALAALDAPQQAAALWQWLLWDEPTGSHADARRVAWHELPEAARRSDRASLLAAFGRALQAQGRYRAAQQAHAQWQALYPVLLPQRDVPWGAEAMLDLHAAERHQAAEVLLARVRLEAAQFHLARQAGLPPAVLQVVAVPPKPQPAASAAPQTEMETAGTARGRDSAGVPWPALDATAAAASMAVVSTDAWVARCRTALDDDPAAIGALRDAVSRHQQAVELFLEAALATPP